MFIILLALFVAGPIAEIYVLLAAGGAFGVWPVVLACMGTAVLGGFILRLQGLAALNNARRDLDEGKPPVAAAADGIFLLIAAPFLMTPGFLTDAIGFLLLVPPVRRWIARAALGWLKKRIDNGEAAFVVRRREP